MKSLPFLPLALAFLALQGCRIDKPSTVVPPPPSIDVFTSSAVSAPTGGTITLTWKTSNATSVELREAVDGALSTPENTLEGSVEVTLSRDSVFVLAARGPGGTDARALTVTVEGSAGTVTLHALPPVIPGGTTSTLVWTAPSATSVSLTTGATTIDTRGQLSAGAVTVAPTTDTTYTLTANGQTATVDVVVQPALLTLRATPGAVEVGDTVTLSWTAAGAEKIVISSPGRGQLAEIVDRARIVNGTFDDVIPTLPNNGLVTWEVAAVKGTEQLTKTVEAFVGTGLRIVRFDAPPVAPAGGAYLMRWQTIAADRIELKVDGVTVHSRTGGAAASGSFSFNAPAQDFAVELVASNSRGGRTAQLAQVDSVGVPTTASLTASPASVTIGQPVTLSFASGEARRVRITTDLGDAVFSTTGQRAESGSIQVFPSRDTTYTLVADNMLGNPAVTATASVTATGTSPTVGQFPPTALSGQRVQLRASEAAALLVGFPHEQVLASSQADFRDISATGVKLLELGGNVASIELPFSTRLWGAIQSGSLTVSRAGWMAWAAPLTVNSSETSLPSTSTSAAPGLIAPYWDNLTLTANSGVYAEVVGDAPDQELIVQWDRMQVGTTGGTEATFQARVHQTGRIAFQYRTMTLGSSPSFTVGIQDPSRSVAVTSSTTPTSNTARYFFSPVNSPVDLRVAKGVQYGGFVVSMSGVATPVSATPVALSVPQDLAVTELMFRPASTVPGGQYVEFFNRTSSALDLSGWTLASSDGTSFEVGSFTLAPGLTVVGASTDPALNDDAGVALAWGALTLPYDGGTLTFRNPDAGLSLPFAGPTDGGVGASLEFDPGPFLGLDGGTTMSCEAVSPFGAQTPQQLGTPGSLRNCFGYVATPIPSRFVDISDGGTALLSTASSSRTVPVTLAASSSDPAPIAFGVRQPVISVSTSGWIAWGSTTTTSITNKTVPTTTAPRGVVAPFWDYMETLSAVPNSNIYWKRFAQDEDPATPTPHWVILWSHVSHTAVTPDDDLNFEVMLFEDGTIEYHYGTMTSGTSTDYGSGSSATVWLENLDGTFALVQSVNQPVVVPNSAWRFSPR